MKRKEVVFLLICLLFSYARLCFPYPSFTEKGLIGYWGFNEEKGKYVKDSSCLGNVGEVIGAKRVKGIIGNALNFNGKTNYVRIPYSTFLSPKEQLTISCWFYLIDKKEGVFVSNRESGGYALEIMKGGNIRFMVSIDNKYKEVKFYSGDIILRKWYYLVATYDGNNISVYLDGELKRKKEVGKGKITYAFHNPLIIGAEASKEGVQVQEEGFFKGIIDEVAIYNRALKKEEIKKIYSTYLKGNIVKGEEMPNLLPKSAKIKVRPDGTGVYKYEDNFSSDKYLKDVYRIITKPTQPSPLYKSKTSIGLYSPTRHRDEVFLLYRFKSPYPMRNIILTVDKITRRKLLAGHMTISKSLDGQDYIEIYPDTPSYYDEKRKYFRQDNLKINISETKDYQNIKELFILIHMWESSGVVMKNTPVTIERLGITAELIIPEEVSSLFSSIVNLRDEAQKINFSTQWLFSQNEVNKELKKKAQEIYKKSCSLYQNVGNYIYSPTKNKIENLERSLIQCKKEMQILSSKIKKPDYCIGIENTLTKVFKERTLFEGKIENNVSISMARNEYQGFQVVVIPLKKKLKNVRVEFSPLINKKENAKIERKYISWNKVGYVYIREARCRTERLGWWPDPLLPSDIFDVEENEIQPLWFTIYAPPYIPAGEYEGKIKISPENSFESEVKVKVNIWNFNLPEEFHFPVCIWSTPQDIAQFFFLKKPLPFEIYKKYLDLVANHRVSPGYMGGVAVTHDASRECKIYLESDGSYTFDYSKMDKILHFILDEKHCNSFVALAGSRPTSLQKVWKCPVIERTTGKKKAIEFKVLSKEYMDFHARWIKDYANHLRQKGWLRKAHFHIFDDAPAAGQTAEVIKKYYGMIKKVAPEIPRQTNVSGLPYGFFEKLIGYIDIWGPLPHKYVETIDFYKERKKEGDKVWWYVCGCRSPEPPLPNFVICQKAIETYMLFPLCWKYQIDGFFYWGFDNWIQSRGLSRERLKKDISERWPNAPWVVTSTPGDGYLIYPGPKVDHPLSSVRLEVIRDGIEDLEYLYLLKEKIQKLRKKGLKEKYKDLIEDAEKLLKIDEIAKDLHNFTRQPRKIYKFRSKIATKIQEINEILSVKNK